jgi:hypothetical protein
VRRGSGRRGRGGEVSGRSVFHRREAREGRDRSADQDWCGSGEEARREQRSGGRMGAAVAREEVRQGGRRRVRTGAWDKKRMGDEVRGQEKRIRV